MILREDLLYFSIYDSLGLTSLMWLQLEDLIICQKDYWYSLTMEILLKHLKSRLIRLSDNTKYEFLVECLMKQSLKNFDLGQS